MSESQRPRASRRAQRPGAVGSDPTPQRVQRRVEPVRASENTDVAWGENRVDSNDARLRQDVPPHWG